MPNDPQTAVSEGDCRKGLAEHLKRQNGIWWSPWMLVCSVTFDFEKKNQKHFKKSVCWSLTVNAKFVLILLNQT